MKILTSTLALGLALILAAPASAQRETPPQPGTPRPFTLPATRDFTLDNGMRVTLIPYGQVPKTAIRLVTRVGSTYEGADEVWLAAMMGDMMQEGTATRTNQQIAAEAARYGGSVGVGVGANETSISGEVLAEFAPEMITLIADVARNPSFPASELTRIKANRVRSLSVARSQPQSLANERFRAILYPNHPYGRLFPTAEMIQGYGVEQLRAFHTTHFGAARSHLYIAGRFDDRAVESAVRSAFGDWARGAASQIGLPTPQSTRAVHLIDRPGAVQSTIILGLPVADPSHADYVALEVTDALLGGSFGSRITTNIREQKGYTYSPWSFVSSRYRDAYWAQNADVTTNVTGASLKEIFFEIDRLRAEAPGAEELRGIQNNLSGIFVIQNSSRFGLIGQLAFLDLHGLGRDYLATYVQRINALTPQDVQRIARTYLDPSRMTIVVVGDRSVIEEQLRPFGQLRGE
jgi:zinc protease